MEGRHPPPKAEHPYPNNPDLFKFWGAPYGRSVFRVCVVGTVFFGSLAALNIYVSQGYPNILGMVGPTREEALRKRELYIGGSSLSQHKLPVEMVSRTNKNLQFDDGLRFSPATEEIILNAKSS